MAKISKRIYFSIGLGSMGVIAYELVLMQIFSITQWYHFAYMVLSVAMLGFGAAGTFLTLFESWFRKRFEMLFPSLLLLSGLSMALMVGVSSASFFRFDTYLIFSDIRQAGRLLLTYFLFFIPFFLAALAIGLAYVHFIRQIGALYFSDLLGSGLGGVLGISLMWFLFPQELPGWIALLPISAGILSLKRNSGKGVFLIALVALATVMFSIIRPVKLRLSEFKSLSTTLLLPASEVEYERNSPYGLVQVVSSPMLRHAPGLSLNFPDTVPVRKAVFNNGEWVGAVVLALPVDSIHLLDYTTTALPFFLKERAEVLVLNAGTGEQVAYAISRGARRVSMQEDNAVLVSLLSEELARETDSLLFHPALTVFKTEARTLLYLDTSQYDLIHLPMVSSFGGTSGLDALQEQYFMTLEAMEEMWVRLKPQGVISISSWLDYPARNPLKVLATLVEALENQGVERSKDHLLAIKSWGTITFLLKRSPFTMDELSAARRFCQDRQFDPVILPGPEQSGRDSFHQLQDTSFFSNLDRILSPKNRADFYNAYEFKVRPATDNRPYFNQFLRWKGFATLFETYGMRGVPFLEIGYLIVVLTFFQILVIAILLIILPLMVFGKVKGPRWRVLGYFGGIGLGYMFVEIVLIQRFILYLGNPIYASAAVISILLVASGLGSYFSPRLLDKGYRNWMAPAAIILLLFLLAVFLNPVLLGSIGWSTPGKLTILILLLFPLGFIMGIPFPTGMAGLATAGSGTVPWAWGVNGYFSVISTAMATIVAVEFGFAWVMVLAAAGYLLAAFSQFRM